MALVTSSSTTSGEKGANQSPAVDALDHEKEAEAMLDSGDSDEDSEEEIEKGHDQQSQIIGTIGPWQLMMCGVTALSIIIHAWQMMANKFLTYPVDHWCSRPPGYQDLSLESWLNLSAPILGNGDFDRCHRFDLNYSNPGLSRPDEHSLTVPCSSWEYDMSVFQVYVLYIRSNLSQCYI